MFLVTTFYADNLLLEEGNKCFDSVKSYGFVQEDWNDGAMHRKVCHVAKKHDTPVEGNAKIETQAMTEPFERKLVPTSRKALLEKLSRVIVLYGIIGLIMETLG